MLIKQNLHLFGLSGLISNDGKMLVLDNHTAFLLLIDFECKVNDFFYFCIYYRYIPIIVK